MSMSKTVSKSKSKRSENKKVESSTQSLDLFTARPCNLLFFNCFFTSTISPVVAREAVLQLVELFRHRHICEAVAGYPMDEIWRKVDPGALSWSPFKWPSHIQYLRSIKELVHATCGYFKEELWVLGRNHAHRIQLWDLYRWNILLNV